MNEETANPFADFTLSGILNSGILNKAADTALDVYALREAGKVVGSVYPTGQINPASVANRLNVATVTAPAPFDYKPYVIGVAALLGIVLVLKAVR